MVSEISRSESLVCTSILEYQDRLRNRIIGIFQRVRESFQRRTDTCVWAAGRHFQQFLYMHIMGICSLPRLFLVVVALNESVNY